MKAAEYEIQNSKIDTPPPNIKRKKKTQFTKVIDVLFNMEEEEGQEDENKKKELDNEEEEKRNGKK